MKCMIPKTETLFTQKSSMVAHGVHYIEHINLLKPQLGIDMASTTHLNRGGSLRKMNLCVWKIINFVIP